MPRPRKTETTAAETPVESAPTESTPTESPEPANGDPNCGHFVTTFTPDKAGGWVYVCGCGARLPA